MTTADVSTILAALTDLTGRVNSMVEKLARIEERTSVLSDHEIRIRDAEKTARVAGETAVRAEGVAKAQAVRIEALELANAEEQGGVFALSRAGQVVAWLVGIVGAALGLAAYVHNW
jgi:hypothetical protein